MAGIGFELRKAIVSPRGPKRSGGYFSAAFTCFGGMLIGIILLSLIQFAANRAGISQSTRDLFMSYITNAMFISMLASSVLSQVVSRYVSDMLYEGLYEAIMPSLIGCVLLTLAIGGIVFFSMILASALPVIDAIALMLLFATLCLCWVLMNYISLLRDYQQITLAFVAALIIAGMAVLLFSFLSWMKPTAMLLILIIAYSTVDALLFRALYRGFPVDDGGIFDFLKWLKRNPALSATGLLMELGLLGHFWLTWYLSAQGIHMQGLFVCSPSYDFPAIIAYFCTIPAMVYFIAVFETDFYEHYHEYLSQLTDGRTSAVDHARNEIISSIRRGIRNFSAIQIISCLLFITIGAKLLSVLNIGMTEIMLDTFRLSCVGYSLYAIGNVLLLLQMYFVNERRSVISVGIFAGSVALITLADIHLNGRTTGLGLCVGSFLLVITSALQLVHCLDHLEYHILCESAIDLTPLHVSRKKPVGSWLKSLRPIHLQSMGAVSLAACLIMITVSSSILLHQAWQASRIRVFTPQQSDAVLLSPGIGYAPWANADETEDLPTTLVYVELRWADWEPEEGVFNTDFVNEEFNLDTYRAQNRQVVFRFICDEPTDQAHIDIPDWLYLKTADGKHYITDYGMGYSPNYQNNLFIKAHARAVTALGEAFGNDDFFRYVEIGSLGHWGEYHVNLEQGVPPLPFYDTRIEYITPYLSAFPDALFMTRYPLLETVKFGFGMYNDMTGDATETNYWLSQMTGGIWEQTGLPEQGYCIDTWKTAPIAGEFASTFDNSYFLRDNLSVTLELLQKSHQSILGPKIIIDETDEDFSFASKQILNTLGYRLTVPQLQVDTSSDTEVQITMDLINKGSAPVYDFCTIKLMLYNENEECLWQHIAEQIDLTKLLPNEIQQIDATIPRDLLDDDEQYTITIHIDDEQDSPYLPMALEEEYAEKEYTLAVFNIDQ